MQQLYAEGANLGFGGSKSKALKRYLDAVNVWYRNEESAFLNEKIAEVIEKVQERLKLYYENILRPLTDILMELPTIFDENVRYIRVTSDKVDEGTDILIRPLEFEQTRKNVFDAAVLQAENAFLGSLSGNIRKWIGRDIDEVDEKIGSSPDIAGFISNFISENFEKLLTVDMQTIMNTKLKPGETLPDYIRNRVDDLLNFSYPMYKESTGLNGSVEEFSMISVPSNCPVIYQVTEEHIKQKGLSTRVVVKKSKEESRMYIIKIASGYPLYSNAFIEGMEKAYEDLMGDQSTSSGKHLKPEWRDRFPSPYIERAWKAPYICERTKKRNIKYRELFDKCYESGSIIQGSANLLLRRANPEIAKNISKENLTAPTLLEKVGQFQKMQAKLWNRNDSVTLHTCSTYMKAKGKEGEIENVKENILRFPTLLDMLEEESKLADKLVEIDEELHYPKYFAMADINHMLYINSITGDTDFKRTATDAFPVHLTKGQEMYSDYKDYQIYKSFCDHFNQEIKGEIELQYENLKKRIEINPKELEAYVKEIHKKMQLHDEQADKALNEMYNASKEDRPAFLEKIEFYQGTNEELKRMLPIGTEETAKEKKQESEPIAEMAATSETASAAQPMPEPPKAIRYLNPQTWQPVEPQPGQQVFDTQIQQMITYQPEPPKAIRYLNPQTWQPVEPQPGQQVFDTQTQRVIIYQPEPPKAVRYLNPQTWQPVEPQPGQMVFDTQIQQMIQYTGYPQSVNPYQQSIPGGQPPYQQPMPGGQPAYQQPMPGNQSPYQQPIPGGQPAYQQPIAGGQPPYQQSMPGGQPPYQQPMPGSQPAYQQPMPGNQSPYQQPMPGGYGYPGTDNEDQ